MTKTYHIPFSSDGEANKAFWEIRGKVVNAGGNSHVAPSFGHGRAYIVVNLASDLTTEQVNEITHPHTANEVIVLEIANAQELPEVNATPEQIHAAVAREMFAYDEEDDDDFDLDIEDDDQDNEEDDYWIDDEEYEVDESEEDFGDEPGADSGEEGTEPGSESSETTTLGGTEVSAE
jgi:hypothetical protein